MAVWNCALVRWTARGRRRKQQFEKKTEMCNFSATWFTCQISLPMQPGTAILKKKKGTVQFHCNLVRLQFGKTKPRNVQFQCNLVRLPNFNFFANAASNAAEKRNCAISAPPGALGQLRQAPVQFHCRHFVNCAISLPPRAQAATVQFHCRLALSAIFLPKRELCNFNATRGICAISLPPCAAGIVNRAIPLPPWATAAAVQFRCRRALAAILLPTRAVCKFAAALCCCAISMPNAATVQFRCRLAPLSPLCTDCQLCNFIAAPWN